MYVWWVGFCLFVFASAGVDVFGMFSCEMAALVSCSAGLDSSRL